MVRRMGFTFLFLLFTIAGSVVSAAEPAGVIWWELKSRKTKALLLRWGKFPSVGEGERALGSSVIVDNAEVWVRNPDGAILPVSLSIEKDLIVLRLPTELNGLYVAGIHLDAGVMDFDSDGANERIHLYSNRLIYHRRQGGITGNKPDAFFKDPDNMVLEIGALIAQGKSGGMSYMRAGNQSALKKYKMRVLYKGQPLEDAEVTILTENGWKRRVRTDDQGTFSITPLESKQKEEKYLYVVVHKEPLEGEYNGVKYISEYHCATLSMIVQKPLPEWWSKSRGFTVWAILGTGLFIISVIGAVYHKRKLDNKTIVRFEKHKIKRD